MKNILIISVLLMFGFKGFGQDDIDIENINWSCLFPPNNTNVFWTLKQVILNNDTTYSHKKEDISTYGLSLGTNFPLWENGKDTIYNCAFQLDPTKQFASKPHGKFSIDKINNRVTFNNPIVHKENTSPSEWVTLNKVYSMEVLKIDCKEFILLQKSSKGKRMLVFKK